VLRDQPHSGLDLTGWTEIGGIRRLDALPFHGPFCKFVTHGLLVVEPKDWLWSSFRHYAYAERGPVW